MEDTEDMEDWSNKARLDIFKFWPNSHPSDNLPKIDFITFIKRNEIDR